MIDKNEIELIEFIKDVLIAINLVCTFCDNNLINMIINFLNTKKYPTNLSKNEEFIYKLLERIEILLNVDNKEQLIKRHIEEILLKRLT